MSDEIDIKELEYEVEPDVWKPVFTVDVEPSIDQDPSKVGIQSWEMIKFDSQYMEIQLTFENPLQISFET